ncbi:45 kDa calcium-binding protein-like [Mizuhopecten yessoensis]|uniref:45 kDa calcium-binding protein n=1 Tax=Mizuhopecten yessoensis TaxID=6573 RepID=A0A210Q5J2_MIZYE|nr:45 kDa calcium-binding protein-like [Mizuhopecten yessoensis]OWF44013.1 45 kDa calcium-binding protein [Mizuhopecten yessoensis]
MRRSAVVLFVTYITLVSSRPPRDVVARDVIRMDMGDTDNDLGQKPVLSVDKLVPPDHLDAVRLEQDGHINKDFHKEAFLGNHEEIDDEPAPVAESKLHEIFKKVDTNGDGFMEANEMQKWILLKINDHFDESMKENSHIFKHMDPKKKGYIEWKEYYRHFLLAKGYEDSKASKHIEDYDTIDMKDDERESLVRYKFRWTDADQDNNNKLTEEEFLAFRHPEQSQITMNNMLETILNGLDVDKDSELTEEEFCALPPGEVVGEEQKEMDRKWQEERRQEFRNSIDRNGDKKADKAELLKYVDPRNPDQARSETENLINMMDENKDRLVTMEEMMINKDIFVSSKCVDVKRVLHDEF